MKKLLTLFVAIIATGTLWASNVITYTASEKLETSTSTWDSGLHTDAFNCSITSHTFSDGTGTITFTDDVTSIGDAAFYECSGLTSITIPNTVTSIGNEAFNGCSGLTSITIPNSVTSIGEMAFYYCSSLTSITIPNSVTSIGNGVFSECSALPVENGIRYADTYLVEVVDQSQSTYTIKDGTMWIGYYAFRDCSSLKSINIPNSVTSIGNYAFRDCSGLTSITIPESVTSIGDAAFYECSALTSITIPESVTSIEYATFFDCTSLTSITIPESVTSIGYAAFSACSSLTSITIPKGVTSIGNYTFRDCSSLKSINIPNSVTSIGSYAFSGCSSLTSITWNSINYASPSRSSDAPFYVVRTQITEFTLGDKVESIPAYLCSGMSKLTSIDIPESVTSIRDAAFLGCSGLTSITIPESVKTIGKGIFYNCSGLKSITWNAPSISGDMYYYEGDGYYLPFSGAEKVSSFVFGPKVETIPAFVCYNMPISEIIIPESVTTIEYSAFRGCTNLTSITIPSSVTSIEEKAFEGCAELYHITCYASEPPAINQNTFANYNVNLNVPCDYFEDYNLHAVWGSFKYIQCIAADNVEEITEVAITPAEQAVTILWPASENAETYTLVIMKDGEIVCTLTFNSNGQLTDIAFAPSRNDERVPARAAQAVAGGWQFTVTGLNPGTNYTYTFTTTDAEDNVVAEYAGSFSTTEYISTAIEESVNVLVNTPTKTLRDGQLLIQRDGKTYNIQGVVVE